MSLSQHITDDMKEAMKAKNDATLSTLRLLRSALKNKEIDLQHPLTDEEITDVIKVQVKQIKDAITQFEEGGRADLAESNKQELLVLQKYLPAELSDEELEKVVKEALETSGVTTKAEMGKAMGAVMKAVAGRADGTRVKSLVETLLGVFVFAMVANTVGAQEVHAQIGMVDTASVVSAAYVPYIETLVRFARVLFLFAGIISVLELMKGGVQLMTSSARDSSRGKAEGMIFGGFVNSGIVVVIFLVTTVVLNKIA